MSIKVISAYYGNDVHQLIDVSEKVQTYIEQRQDSQEIAFKVSAENLDLSFLFSREEIGSLHVYYRFTEDNIIRVKTAVENAEIIFYSSLSKEMENNLELNNANNYSQNITHLMNNYISGNEEFSKKNLDNSFTNYFFFEHDINSQS